MKKNRKFVFPAAAASFVALTSFTHATTDSAQMRNLENRINALEQRKGANGMINPPGRPQVRDGVNLFFIGELLCWNAHENGLPVAVVNRGSSSNLSNSKAKTIHSDWDLGLRVGIGYNTPHDGWDLDLTWVRLHTEGSEHIHSHSNRYVFPSRVHPSDLIASSSAAKKGHSHWKLHFNQLDLDLGREFFVSKWLTLRPHFGLRTDWIHQTWKSTFRNFSGTATPNKVKVSYRDHWWGIGLQGGLDTQWGLGCGWSLFANMAGGIIYGIHDLDFKDKDSPAQLNTTTSGTFANLDNGYRIAHPVMDGMLGVRYDHMFCNDRFHLGLEIGWEHHIYFSQNQFPVFTSDDSRGTLVSNQGDLTFQGWTVAARFDF